MSAQLRTALAIAEVVLGLIQNAGKAGIPSGHLYAELMSVMNLDTYEAVIDLLIRLGKVHRASTHLLTATCSQ